MASIYDPSHRQSLLDRVANLRADRPAAWGKFTAPKMVQHLIESLKMVTGENAPKPRPFPMQFLVRPLVVHLMPWPKGAPTAPELLAGKPTTWDADLAALRTRIAQLPVPADGATLPPHPAFGPMSKRDWGVLLYRHLDHHLKQFGV
jgi:hypothetical protein